MPVRILLIEDDIDVREGLVAALGGAGFAASATGSGFEGLEAISKDSSVDLVVLDVGLPDIDGFDLMHMIRRISAVPLIFATARGEERQKVRGLDLGADDYIVKPFGAGELVARINAVLRRHGLVAPAAERYEIGDLVVDAHERSVTLEGRPIELSRKEFELLALLARESPRVVHRHRIVHEVWDPHWYGPTKTVDVHISWIRRKLGEDGEAPRYVHTVRGVGFRLIAPPP